MIQQFQGKFRWLSNFAPVQIRLGNKTFASVEHAYMSMKSTDPNWKNVCALPGIKPGKVKRMSRDIELREDWECIKLRVMFDLLKIKFGQQPYKDLLSNTKDQNIQEGNLWGDRFWGICLKTGLGENHLGRMIMEIRAEQKGRQV